MAFISMLNTIKTAYFLLTYNLAYLEPTYKRQQVSSSCSKQMGTMPMSKLVFHRQRVLGVTHNTHAVKTCRVLPLRSLDRKTSFLWALNYLCLLHWWQEASQRLHLQYCSLDLDFFFFFCLSCRHSRNNLSRRTIKSQKESWHFPSPHKLFHADIWKR